MIAVVMSTSGTVFAAFAEIYTQAMPDDPADLYDGAKMADRLASAIARVRNSRPTN